MIDMHCICPGRDGAGQTARSPAGSAFVQPEGAAGRLKGMRTPALLAAMAAIAGCGLAPAHSAMHAAAASAAVATPPPPLIVTSVSFRSPSDGWLLAPPPRHRAPC